MTDKEAMAMALDALETEVSIDWTNNDEFNASAEKMHEAIAALKERLAQPEQEPTAKYSDIVSDGGFDPRNKFDVQPQRTWVDLSDEDIEECFTITPDLYLKRHIAQRISDKLKDKNNA